MRIESVVLAPMAKGEPMKKWYLYFPFVVFVLYFTVEKVMWIPWVQRMTQSDATYLYFNYKHELLDQLEETWNRFRKENEENRGKPGAVRKKIFIVIGSSRLLYFDYKEFRRTFPDWEMYNFSAPVTVPAYYDWILERILERGIVPDYVLLEADPFQFNKNSNAFNKSTLGYGFDLRYILSHFNLFTRDEVSHYIGRSLFAAYHYPPNLKNFLDRRKNSLDRHLMAFNMVDEFQRENNGAGRSLIPRQDWYERDFASLTVTSERTKGWLYGNYRLSERQFTFLESALKRLDAKKIPVTLIRPVVSRPLERMISGDEKMKPILKVWETRMDDLLGKYHTPYIDLRHSPGFTCNTFVDGSHMSLDCYHPMMITAMRQYWGVPAGSDQ